MPWNISAVSAGFSHSCAIASANRSLWCWGGNTTISMPLEVVRADNFAVAGPFVASSSTSFCSGKWFVCAVDASSTPFRVRCFNASSAAFLEITFLPSSVMNPASGIRMVACGEYHICTNTFGNALACAAVTTKTELTPTAALLVPSSGGNAWRDVSCGRAHTCGITLGNTLLCWGDTSWQQGPARIVPKYPISSTSDPAFNNVVLVGVNGSSDDTCFVNKSCATLAQAASLIIMGQSISISLPT